MIDWYIFGRTNNMSANGHLANVCYASLIRRVQGTDSYFML